MDYASIVSELLLRGKYPILDGYVFFDIYFKMIPFDYPSTYVARYDRHMMNPEDVYIRESRFSNLHYLVAALPHHFYLHRIDTLDVDSFPLQCITIKLTRSFLDTTVLNVPSASFEEEIYHFLTLLNCDVPRVASLLNLNFIASTRFLPQRIKLWVFKYSEQSILYRPLSIDQQACFGPPACSEVIPIRVLCGRLAECTSRSTLLSLNNHFHVPDMTYLNHLSEKWKTVIPLAFNPLENPIMTS